MFNVVLLLTVRVQHPTALTRVRTFDKRQLRLPGDTNDLRITGMSMTSDGELLCADDNNGRIKWVSPSTGAVRLAFGEGDGRWGVSSCVLADTAEVQFMAITEWMKRAGLTDTRVVFAGPRDASDKFAEHHSVHLPEKTEVCLGKLSRESCCVQYQPSHVFLHSFTECLHLCKMIYLALK